MSTSRDAISLRNEWLELLFGIEDELGSFKLIDRKSSRVLADNYLYRFVDTDYVKPVLTDWIVKRMRNEVVLSLEGAFKEVKVRQIFRIPYTNPWIEEEICVGNLGGEALNAPKLACGFVRNVDEASEGWRFVAIPFRRELQGLKDEYVDFPPSRILSGKGWFWVWNGGIKKIDAEAFGAEAWAVMDESRDQTLLVLKYSREGIEHSLIESVEGSAVRFGGAGVWLLGDPEKAVTLLPDKTVKFGPTWYELVEGSWKQAYYVFRRFMREQGHGLPEGYDPPVHWNELYDNPLWWEADTPERRSEHYRLENMLTEAEKASELGCESLYLDPGWDTRFGSSIWAEDRLEKLEDFLRIMKEKFDLKVSLHTPLAGWSDVEAYPAEARRQDNNGETMKALCMGSKQYIEEKANRLAKLCKAGVAFFMFDGTFYTGPCFAERHGHPIPYTRVAHCRAILELARMVHKACPSVLIEMHDPIVSGVPIRYAPVYYLHEPGGFDEVWAFEYMWNPMDDLLSGRAISLYYYNLAYELPLYIHIDLRKDNEHALEFWWYASTCRHLGVGGKHPDTKIWEAHKRAMKTYKELKDFYVKGAFYGLSEEVHAHTLPDKGKAVLNVFNLSDKEGTKQIDFRPTEIGLPNAMEFRVVGVSHTKREDRIHVTTELPAYGQGVFLVEAVQP